MLSADEWLQFHLVSALKGIPLFGATPTIDGHSERNPRSYSTKRWDSSHCLPMMTGKHASLLVLH
jgi:hypothetical protein